MMTPINNRKSIGFDIQLVILGESTQRVFSDLGLSTDMSNKLTEKIIREYGVDYERTYAELQRDSDLNTIRQVLLEKQPE